MADALVALVIFGTSGLLIWKYLENRHILKMTLLEKGISSFDEPKILKAINEKKTFYNSLRIGLVVFFSGVGISIGTIIKESIFTNIWSGIMLNRQDPSMRFVQNHFDELGVAIMFASILICGGMGLLTFYIIASKKEKKEQKS